MSNQYDQNAATLAVPSVFQLPAAVDNGFSADDMAEDMDGMELSFPRVKIPGGGVPQFEMPGEDPDHPTYAAELEGVILYNHAANAYWRSGEEYSDSTPPQCQSMDGKRGSGDPGLLCATCGYNQFGSGPKGSGKACKNQRMLYILRSGEFMPLQLALPPTSLKPYKNFFNAVFALRNRPVYGSLVNISLKRASSNGYDYSVAVFRKVRDFAGDELPGITAYAEGFRKLLKESLEQRAKDQAEAAANAAREDNEPLALPDNDGHFAVGLLDGERDLLPA